MKNRRWAVAGLLAAVLFTPTIAACSTDSTSDKSTSDDPKAVLTASTKALDEGNFRFSMVSGEMTGEGLVHKESRSAQMKMTMESEELSMEFDMIFVDGESWVKIDFGELGKLPGMEALSSGKYLHMDPSKITNEDFKFDWDKVDPAGVNSIIKAFLDIEKTGEGVYSGTIDLAKAKDASLVDDDIVKAVEAENKPLPFTAKLDGQGRLTELVIDVPAVGEIKAQQLKVTYFDYGSATAAEKPAESEVAEATDEVYQMFN